jgi:hypothetical protein
MRILEGGCLLFVLSMGVSSTSGEEWHPMGVSAAPVAPRPIPAAATSQPGSSAVLGKPQPWGPVAPQPGTAANLSRVVETPTVTADTSRKPADMIRGQTVGQPIYPDSASSGGYPAPSPTGAEGGAPFVGSGNENGPFGGPLSFVSDDCFEHARFISPTSNPFFFEDPRSLTEIRPIFIYQHLPGDHYVIASNPAKVRTFDGGDVEFFGLQARLALNECFSIVLHKLGFVAFQPDGHGVFGLDNEAGFADLQVGVKYTFLRNTESNTIAAVGVNFEIPTGDEDVFQDTGSGAWTPYLSVAQQLGNFHFMGSAGYRISFDNRRSESLFTSLHLDYEFFGRLYPLIEVNWYHYVDNGRAHFTSTTGGDGFEGQDLFNFGSTNIEDHDIVTLAAGARFKFTTTIEGGMVAEFPLTGREDLLDFRLTTDVIFRY